MEKEKVVIRRKISNAADLYDLLEHLVSNTSGQELFANIYLPGDLVLLGVELIEEVDSDGIVDFSLNILADTVDDIMNGNSKPIVEVG